MKESGHFQNKKEGSLRGRNIVRPQWFRIGATTIYSAQFWKHFPGPEIRSSNHLTPNHPHLALERGSFLAFPAGPAPPLPIWLEEFLPFHYSFKGGHAPPTHFLLLLLRLHERVTHLEAHGLKHSQPHPIDRMYIIAWPGDPEPVTQVGEPCHGWPYCTVQRALVYVMHASERVRKSCREVSLSVLSSTLFMFLWWPRNTLILQL